MPSELISRLFKRRREVEAAGEKWESNPEVSSADASHLASLKFDAPPAQAWLHGLDVTPEEDQLAEAIADELNERRQALPKHLKLAITEEDSKRLSELTAQLAEYKKALDSERQGLGEVADELARRQADIQAREAALGAERKSQQEREEAQRNYPQPKWLDNVVGVMNIGVVGNSGVGKSLLINKLRRIRPHAHGWAPVGVCETTLEPTKYPFPGQPKVCLWDLPGSGTKAVPSQTYIQDMGLRYFDKVLICTAGRFTETEIKLREELNQHSIPFYMVRTKVDIDALNNREDNGQTENATCQQIRDDLTRNHGVPDVYLVSSRDPESYDMPKLLKELFPGMKREMDPKVAAFVPMAPAWNDPWAMPVIFSAVLQGLQGRWHDNFGATYVVQGNEVHITWGGQCSLVPLVEANGCVWWLGRRYVNEQSIQMARRRAELCWAPLAPQDEPVIWKWAD